MAYKWSSIVRVVVRPYPTYLCRREWMNISSTVEIRICQRALSVRIEECGCGVESIAKFSDLVASGVGWDDG